MNAAVAAVLAFAAGFVAALAYGAIVARNRSKTNMTTQTSVDTAVERIRGLDTVVGSAVSALALVHTLWTNALAATKAAQPDIDTSQLDAAAAEADRARADLAAAIAANTPASDEVHTDNGGTGTTDGGTVVDPAAVDTSAVTDPAPAAGA